MKMQLLTTSTLSQTLQHAARYHRKRSHREPSECVKHQSKHAALSASEIDVNSRWDKDMMVCKGEAIIPFTHLDALMRVAPAWS
jgi:hypothetical protein